MKLMLFKQESMRSFCVPAGWGEGERAFCVRKEEWLGCSEAAKLSVNMLLATAAAGKSQFVN